MIESFKLPTITPETISGSIVSFNNEYGGLPLKSCTSLISGYQEGSGKPYPAGGSAQTWDEETVIGTINNDTGIPTGSVDNIRSTNYIPVTGGETYYIKLPSNTWARIFQYDSNKNFLYSNAGYSGTWTMRSDTAYIMFYLPASYGTTYNNDISINYPATDTDYHPYSNIRPLHAFSSGTLIATGKNLLESTMNVSCALITDGIRIVSGGTSLVCHLKKGMTYTISGVTINRGVIGFFDSVPSVNDETEITQTIPNIGVSTFISNYDGLAVIYINNGNVDVSTAIIELGNTDTAYEPYNGNTHTFTFGKDIYQGSIDWKRGVAIASRVILRDYTNIQIYAQGIFANTRSYRFETPIDRAKDTFCLSNKFHADVLTDGTNYCFEVSATNTDWVRKSIFFALPASYDTVDKAKQYLIDNNVMFAYGLMNPIEIPLGGIQLLTQNQNNIFADCGDTEVTHPKVT